MQESRVNLWVGMIPWRRKWQPTPVFLPGKSHGQIRLVGYSPWVARVRHDLATKPTKVPSKELMSRWVPDSWWTQESSPGPLTFQLNFYQGHPWESLHGHKPETPDWKLTKAIMNVFKLFAAPKGLVFVCGTVFDFRFPQTPEVVLIDHSS